MARAAVLDDAEATRGNLIGDAMGLVMAPKGQLLRVLRFTFDGDRIASAEVVSDPAQLAALDLGAVE